MARNRGGTGPTGSELKRNRRRETLAFGSYDAADGSPTTDAPGYHSRNNLWKTNISEEDFKTLLNEVLSQHYRGKRRYLIAASLADKIGCPKELTSSDLTWMKLQATYERIARQAHSEYLLTLVGNQRRR